MRWLNEPPSWREEGGVLSVVTGDKTDFWRETHYGFIRDDGHFRHRTVEGDFTAEVAFAGAYETLYDQAGLMLRIDERRWIKAGVELVEGRQMLSAVVTREVSDWSTAPAPSDAEWLRVQVTRLGSAVHIAWSVDGPAPRHAMMRLANLPPTPSIDVGPMCCSPQREGFRVQFRDFTIGTAIAPNV